MSQSGESQKLHVEVLRSLQQEGGILKYAPIPLVEKIGKIPDTCFFLIHLLLEQSQ